MDFKIGDEIQVNGSSSKLKKDTKLPLIIVIVIAIVVGLTVFLVSNSLFGKKPQEEVKRQKLTLNESNVEILYSYITDCNSGKGLSIFAKEPKLTSSKFTDEEKFACALQFAEPEDFVFDEKYKDSEKVYLLSDSKVRKYMQRFFGSKVTYNNLEEVTYKFDFQINGKNFGTMKYNEEEKGYETVFSTKETTEETDYTKIPEYYSVLSAAYKEIDGTYTLEAKVIYPVLEKLDDNTYSLSIYKDYEHKNLLEKNNGLTVEDLSKLKIDANEYKTKSSTITYKFGLNINTLYFESSSVK